MAITFFTLFIFVLCFWNFFKNPVDNCSCTMYTDTILFKPSEQGKSHEGNEYFASRFSQRADRWLEPAETGNRKSSPRSLLKDSKHGRLSPVNRNAYDSTLQSAPGQQCPENQGGIAETFRPYFHRDGFFYTKNPCSVSPFYFYFQRRCFPWQKYFMTRTLTGAY